MIESDWLKTPVREGLSDLTSTNRPARLTRVSPEGQARGEAQRAARPEPEKVCMASRTTSSAAGRALASHQNTAHGGSSARRAKGAANTATRRTVTKCRGAPRQFTRRAPLAALLGDTLLLLVQVRLSDGRNREPLALTRAHVLRSSSNSFSCCFRFCSSSLACCRSSGLRLLVLPVLPPVLSLSSF